MKIAYVVHHDVSKNDGVTKKIDSQIMEWRLQGNEVKLFCLVYKRGETIISDLNQYEIPNFINMRLVEHKPFLNDLYSFSPDLVYYRYDTWSVNLSKILSKYKVVTELNTLDLDEFKLLLEEKKTIKNLLRYIAYKFLRSKVLSKVSGIVSVTKEIGEHQSNLKFGKKTTFVPNSIDLNNYKVKKKEKQYTNNRIGLFFIGTPNQSWHGTDYIKKMSEQMPQYDYHIVGIDGDNTNNLYWHGYLDKKEYLKVLEKCHICIGSLALFRNKMKEACPLKVREYIAYGYPVILGYDDTAFLGFDKLPGWSFKIDCENNLNYPEVEEFIELNADYVLNQKDREVVDVKSNESKRLQFFKEIIASNN